MHVIDLPVICLGVWAGAWQWLWIRLSHSVEMKRKPAKSMPCFSWPRYHSGVLLSSFELNVKSNLLPETWKCACAPEGVLTDQLCGLHLTSANTLRSQGFSRWEVTAPGTETWDCKLYLVNKSTVIGYFPQNMKMHSWLWEPYRNSHNLSWLQYAHCICENCNILHRSAKG